ncbi:hypothetical protein HZA97_05385 [Candidatus Woesearchaeota archaeon]|nr:hypothetical protein [Candidatus Woesearchaeota archaeon]
MPELFGRPLYAYLPWCSYRYELQKPLQERRWWKTEFHSLYAVLSGTVILTTLIASPESGTLNPIEAWKFMHNQDVERVQNKEKREQLYQKIFGPGGYADTNFDKKISSDEMLNAYRKVKWDKVPGSEPTLDDLEKLIKVYESD